MVASLLSVFTVPATVTLPVRVEPVAAVRSLLTVRVPVLAARVEPARDTLPSTVVVPLVLMLLVAVVATRSAFTFKVVLSTAACALPMFKVEPSAKLTSGVVLAALWMTSVVVVPPRVTSVFLATATVVVFSSTAKAPTLTPLEIFTAPVSALELVSTVTLSRAMLLPTSSASARETVFDVCSSVPTRVPSMMTWVLAWAVVMTFLMSFRYVMVYLASLRDRVPALKFTLAAASVSALSFEVSLSVVLALVNTWSATVDRVAVPSRVSLPVPVIAVFKSAVVNLPLVRVKVLLSSTFTVERFKLSPPRVTVEPLVEETVPPMVAFFAVTVEASADKSPVTFRAPSALMEPPSVTVMLLALVVVPAAVVREPAVLVTLTVTLVGWSVLAKAEPSWLYRLAAVRVWLAALAA